MTMIRNRRHLLSLLLFVSSLLAWLPGSHVTKLIIENDPVILGRYSSGHFGALLLLTLVLLTAAAVMFFTRRKPVAETVFALLMVYLSTGLSAFVLVVGSGLVNKPRFIEQPVSGVDPDTGIVLSGTVRHWIPNQRHELLQEDKPEQLRSYPDAPAGYPAFPLVLTSDAHGFRNPEQREQYDIVAVGDSFVAGSHVSDEHAWVDLLRQRTGQSIYNLGVSGTDPLVYLNNFVTVGRKLKPETVLLMLYEGNDFRDAPPVPKAAAGMKRAAIKDPTLSIGFLTKASPVTQGLRRLTEDVLAQVGADAPVPGYADTVGFMPLRIATPAGVQAYSFEPKRLLYLGDSEQAFAASSDWQNVRDVLEQFVMLSQRDGFRLVIAYAPSAPHVVLPLAAGQIPAQQLLNFARMQGKGLPDDADTYKQQVLARLDSQENVWMAWCRERGVECVSTTRPLREAAAGGRQVYFTYDQHWTPDGNAVVAGVLAGYLSGGR